MDANGYSLTASVVATDQIRNVGGQQVPGPHAEVSCSSNAQPVHIHAHNGIGTDLIEDPTKKSTLRGVGCVGSSGLPPAVSALSAGQPSLARLAPFGQTHTSVERSAAAKTAAGRLSSTPNHEPTVHLGVGHPVADRPVTDRKLLCKPPFQNTQHTAVGHLWPLASASTASADGTRMDVPHASPVSSLQQVRSGPTFHIASSTSRPVTTGSSSCATGTLDRTSDTSTAHLVLPQMDAPTEARVYIVGNEDEARCIVCDSGESLEENAILFCDGPCKYAYHQHCWGLRTIPPGDKWYCSSDCEAGVIPKRDAAGLRHVRASANERCRVLRESLRLGKKLKKQQALEFWSKQAPNFCPKALRSAVDEGLLDLGRLDGDEMWIPALGKHYRQVWKEQEMNSARHKRIMKRESLRQSQDGSSRPAKRRRACSGGSDSADENTPHIPEDVERCTLWARVFLPESPVKTEDSNQQDLTTEEERLLSSTFYWRYDSEHRPKNRGAEYVEEEEFDYRLLFDDANTSTPAVSPVPPTTLLVPRPPANSSDFSLVTSITPPEAPSLAITAATTTPSVGSVSAQLTVQQSAQPTAQLTDPRPAQLAAQLTDPRPAQLAAQLTAQPTAQLTVPRPAQLAAQLTFPRPVQLPAQLPVQVSVPQQGVKHKPSTVVRVSAHPPVIRPCHRGKLRLKEITERDSRPLPVSQSYRVLAECPSAVFRVADDDSLDEQSLEPDGGEKVDGDVAVLYACHDTSLHPMFTDTPPMSARPEDVAVEPEFVPKLVTDASATHVTHAPSWHGPPMSVVAVGEVEGDELCMELWRTQQKLRAQTEANNVVKAELRARLDLYGVPSVEQLVRNELHEKAVLAQYEVQYPRLDSSDEEHSDGPDLRGKGKRLRVVTPSSRPQRRRAVSNAQIQRDVKRTLREMVAKVEREHVLAQERAVSARRRKIRESRTLRSQEPTGHKVENVVRRLMNSMLKRVEVEAARLDREQHRKQTALSYSHRRLKNLQARLQLVQETFEHALKNSTQPLPSGSAVEWSSLDPSFTSGWTGLATYLEREHVHLQRWRRTSPPRRSASTDDSKRATAAAEARYCICRTQFDPLEFYLQCDLCEVWYHGRCIGVEEDMNALIEHYVCPPCQFLCSNSPIQEEQSIVTTFHDVSARSRRGLVCAYTPLDGGDPRTVSVTFKLSRARRKKRRKSSLSQSQNQSQRTERDRPIRVRVNKRTLRVTEPYIPPIRLNKRSMTIVQPSPTYTPTPAIIILDGSSQAASVGSGAEVLDTTSTPTQSFDEFGLEQTHKRKLHV